MGKSHHNRCHPPFLDAPSDATTLDKRKNLTIQVCTANQGQSTCHNMYWPTHVFGVITMQIYGRSAAQLCDASKDEVLDGKLTYKYYATGKKCSTNAKGLDITGSLYFHM
ncbi:hypothetical protein BDV06DRAFT_225713 [Aspergillus oleicola]